MPRGPRPESRTGVYHFIVRGINKKKIFHRDDDFRFYLSMVEEYKSRFLVEIYHYCLMTNHAHFLLKSPGIESMGRFAHFTQRRLPTITARPTTAIITTLSDKPIALLRILLRIWILPNRANHGKPYIVIMSKREDPTKTFWIRR